MRYPLEFFSERVEYLRFKQYAVCVTTISHFGTRTPTYFYAISIGGTTTVEIKKHRLKFLQYCKNVEIFLHVTANPITLFNITMVPMVPDQCFAENVYFLLGNNKVLESNNSQLVDRNDATISFRNSVNPWKVQVTNRTTGITVQLDGQYFRNDAGCIYVCPIRYKSIKVS